MIEIVRLVVLNKVSAYSNEAAEADRAIALKRLDSLLNRDYTIVTQEHCQSATGDQIVYVLHRAPQKRGGNNA